jgi:hypothetical protein
MRLGAHFVLDSDPPRHAMYFLSWGLNHFIAKVSMLSQTALGSLAGCRHLAIIHACVTSADINLNLIQ